MKKHQFDPYEVAARYWSMKVDERSFRRVANEMGKKGGTKLQNTLSRLVRQWELDGKVRHHVSVEPFNPDYLPLIPEFEDRIRRRFGLRDVVVVDTSSIPKPPLQGTTPAIEREHGEYDDTVHRKLGTWTARVLASIIRSNDVLGTGSGRGPFYAASAVNIPPESELVPKAVVSLTGHMGVDVWHREGHGVGGIPRRALDADLIADALAKGLRAGKCLPMDTKITEKKPVPSLADVNVALVGVGAVTLGHRLVNFRESADLDDVAKLLAKLNHEARALEPSLEGPGPFHHWLGDLNNELFVVDWAPPDVKPLSTAKRAELWRLVERLNSRFHSAKQSELARIAQRGAVIAVAGGLHKGAAVLHVLRSRLANHGSQRPRTDRARLEWHPTISHLVCDISVGLYLWNAIHLSS